MVDFDFPTFPTNNDCTNEWDHMPTDEAGRNLDERDRHWLTKMDEMNQCAFPKQTRKKPTSIRTKRKRKPKQTKMNRFGFTKHRRRM